MPACYMTDLGVGNWWAPPPHTHMSMSLIPQPVNKPYVTKRTLRVQSNQEPGDGEILLDHLEALPVVTGVLRSGRQMGNRLQKRRRWCEHADR